MLRIKYIISFLIFINLLSGLSALAQNPEIVIDNSGEPEEPTIMMDPKNPNILVAGANITKVYFSTDGGYNWSINNLTSSLGVWGDPCMAVDTNGYFYYFHLSNPPTGSWIDRIVCQKLLSPGGVWTDGAGFGKNGTKVQDKEWAYIDRKTNEIYVTWTQFDKYATQNPAPTDSTIILFSKSTDNGNTWTSPVRINQYAGDCSDGDLTAMGAMPCKGPNGELYAAWANSGVIYFDYSLDDGNSWLAKDIKVCDQPGSWNLNVAGVYRSNGLPVTYTDLSNGPYRGTIYINFCDQRNGITDSDVWLTKSTDGGKTWSESKRVNDDPSGNQQFFSWMAIDQVTGYIYIVFYDRRNYNDNRTDVYLACSTDGGETFVNTRISTSPFTPDQSVFFGDYTNITAYNNKIVPIWARMDNENCSIVCTVINNIVTAPPANINNSIHEQIIEKVYPSSNLTAFNIELNIQNAGKYNMYVYNSLGMKVAALLENSSLTKGKQTINFNVDNLNKGVYYIVISGTYNVGRAKFIFVK